MIKKGLNGTDVERKYVPVYIQGHLELQLPLTFELIKLKRDKKGNIFISDGLVTNSHWELHYNNYSVQLFYQYVTWCNIFCALLYNVHRLRI